MSCSPQSIVEHRLRQVDSGRSATRAAADCCRLHAEPVQARVQRRCPWSEWSAALALPRLQRGWVRPRPHDVLTYIRAELVSQHNPRHRCSADGHPKIVDDNQTSIPRDKNKEHSILISNDVSVMLYNGNDFHSSRVAYLYSHTKKKLRPLKFSLLSPESNFVYRLLKPWAEKYIA